MLSLITGGSGFIGSHLLESLVSKGEEVRVLVRKTSNLSFIKNFDVDIVYGDITDKNSVKRAMDGVDIVYHLAFVDLQNTSPEVYMKTNVNAVRNILDSCMDADVKKILVTSSIMAVGLKNAPEKIDETYDCEPEDVYGKTKFEIEKLSTKYFEESGLPITVVRPSMIYGPRQPKGFNRIFTAIKSGKFVFIGDGKNKWPLNYVQNVVDGMILAVKKEHSIGEIYFLSDEKSYELRDIVEIIAREEGVRSPKIKIPVWLAKIIANSCDSVSKITKIKFPIKKSTVKSLTMNVTYDISKAERDLGYNPSVDLKEGMPITVRWLKEQKIV